MQIENNRIVLNYTDYSDCNTHTSYKREFARVSDVYDLSIGMYNVYKNNIILHSDSLLILSLGFGKS